MLQPSLYSPSFCTSFLFLLLVRLLDEAVDVGRLEVERLGRTVLKPVEACLM
jgi:hypothetical protein